MGMVVIVITGGGSGIGRALALAIAKRGQAVLIVGRREQLLEETASESPMIQMLCADVSTTEGIESIAYHLKAIPKIQALVNNAGVIKPIAKIQDINVDAWHQVFKTNLDAALFLPQKLLPQLASGRVLNIGSGAAYFPIKAWAAYCVSKAALSMLTRCWQEEIESTAFASVMPGIIDTDMQALARNDSNPDNERAQFYQNLKDQGRLISTDTVAAFLTWLLLDVDRQSYSAQEWDIYDTSHHKFWLKPPHQVFHWDI